MNPESEINAPLQELPSILRLYKSIWVFCVENKLLLSIYLLVSFIVSAASSLFGFIIFPESIFGFISVIFLTITIVLLSMFVGVAFVYLAFHSASRKVTLSEIFKWSLQNLHSFIWLGILTGLVMIGTFSLFLIPLLPIIYYLIFTNFIIVNEPQRGLAALVRSHQLVYGVWWKLFIKLVALVAVPVLLLVIVIVTTGLYTTEEYESNVLVILGLTFIDSIISVLISLSIVPIARLYQARLQMVDEDKLASASKITWLYRIFIGLGLILIVTFIALGVFFSSESVKDFKVEAGPALIEG